MRTRPNLKPGQRGTKRLGARYGDRLLCVRYCYDEKKRKRVKTVELIVDEVDWHPGGRQLAGRKVVGLRVGWQELELRQKVKFAGGRWDRVKRVWELPRGAAVRLGLEDRIVGENDGLAKDPPSIWM